MNEPGRGTRGLVFMTVAAFLVTAGSTYLGSADLSKQIATLSLVCLSCYIVYEYLIVKLLYFQIQLRRTRVAPDSPDLRKQVWDDIALVERRVGMVLLAVFLMLAGSILKGLVGIGISLLLTIAIIMYARKSRII
jgi:hypothetical protein